MHDDSQLVERRIRQEWGERVWPAVYPAVVPLEVTAWDTPGEPVSYREAMQGLASDGRPLAVGGHWGRPWGTTWFRLAGNVPAEWATPEYADRLEVVVDLGFHPDAAGFQSEGLVWLPGADSRWSG